MSEPYATLQSDLDNRSENIGALKRWANGNIKLWKAIVFLQIIGWLVAVSICTLSHMFLPKPLFLVFNALVLIPYATYCSLVVWNASANPKISIGGAIAKLWSVIFLIYAFAITYRIVFIVG